MQDTFALKVIRANGKVSLTSGVSYVEMDETFLQWEVDGDGHSMNRTNLKVAYAQSSHSGETIHTFVGVPELHEEDTEEPGIPLDAAHRRLVQEFAANEDYLRGWVDNLAVMMTDVGVGRKVAMEAAEKFMSLAFQARR